MEIRASHMAVEPGYPKRIWTSPNFTAASTTNSTTGVAGVGSGDEVMHYMIKVDRYVDLLFYVTYFIFM